MRFVLRIVTGLAVAGFATSMSAQETSVASGSQTQQITVTAIDNMSLGTAPSAISLSSTSAGTSSSSISYETNAISAEARRIAVKIDGVTAGLVVTVAPTVSGAGTGAGVVTLSASDQSLITSISAGSGSATLAYSAQAALTVAPGSYDKVVTYTMLAP